MSDEEADDVESNVIEIGEFNDKLVLKVSQGIEDALSAKQDVLILRIHSNGGDVDALAAILGMLKTVPIPIATIALGKAASCAAVLLASGTKGYRYAADECTIMVHQMSADVEYKPMAAVEADVAWLKRSNSLFFAWLDKASGKSTGWWQKAVLKRGNSDWVLTPVEAVELGVIDAVGVPIITRKLEVKTVLQVPEKRRTTKKRGKAKS